MAYERAIPEESSQDAARSRVQQLFLRHSATIRGYVLSMVPLTADTDDIFQEAFLAAIDQADQYDPDRPFRPWIYAIVRHRVLAYVRNRQRRSKETLSPAVLEALSDEAPTDRSLEDVIVALEHCLQKLTPTARRLLNMHYLQSIDCAAIAEQLQIKQQSVYNGLNRARSQLRQCVNALLRRESAGGNP